MKTIADVVDLGTTVRTVRKAQGLTQEQLAAACGVGRRFVVELEAGKPSCHVGKTLSVLFALGISLQLESRGGELA